MYNVLIIEDEVSARNHLHKLLKASGHSCQVLASLATVSQSVNWLKANAPPDLIFMDIHLSDGISFDILSEQSVSVPIIYVTAYDQYAIKAFKTTGIDYLLKPITQEDLNMALQKFTSLHRPSDEEQLLKNLETLSLIQQQQKPTYRQRFLVKTGTQLVPVKSEEVAYFYRKDDLVFARVFEGKSYLVDNPLNYLQKVMDPACFFRINRQFLVNLDAIAKANSYRPGQLTVTLNPPYEEPVHLSQERSSRLKVVLGEG
ncbi:MAG: LytTR family DNA-binding domain-containing protein [Roseivirga sp.]